MRESGGDIPALAPSPAPPAGARGAGKRAARRVGARRMIGALRGSASLRLAAMVSAIFVIATLIAALVGNIVLSRELHAKLQRDARQMAENLAATYQVAGLPELHAQIATNVATTREGDNLYLFIDNSGKALFGNFIIKRPFTGARDLEGGRDVILPGLPGKGRGLRFVAYGQRIPAGWVIVARDTRAIEEMRRILAGAIGWGLGIAMLLSVALALMLARRTERRIARLSGVLDRVARGDLSARFREGRARHDDIGRVAAKLNEMLERLSASVESLRQVSNDVAHDLRTPLARLRNRLEPLQARPDLPEAALGEVEQAIAEVDRIVKTFNAVLRIAQIEGGNARPRMARVDLNELAATVHEMLDPVAEEMGHALAFSPAPAPACVSADRDMLAQALVNLVENALRHAPAPAHVEIRVEPGQGEVRLVVADDGPGIPESERAQVLRRFYRLEKSRVREGSGLGLSLVAAIVNLHDAALILADNAPGLRAEIVMKTVDCDG